MKLIQLFIVLSFISCKSQWTKLQIDPSVEKELALNKNADEMIDVIQNNNSYYIFSDEEMVSMFGENDSISSFDKMLLDTTEKLLSNVCACQLKNDTITMSGGLFYGGGIGYQIKIHRKEFDGKIILASTSKKFKKEKEGDFADDIYLNSVKQKLLLTEEPIFQLGKVITGKIAMESQNFFKKNKDELAQDTYWMKIVFECTLEKIGPL